MPHLSIGIQVFDCNGITIELGLKLGHWKLARHSNFNAKPYKLAESRVISNVDEQKK